MLQPLRGKSTSREGAGQLPGLLLDQGQLPRPHSLLPPTAEHRLQRRTL